MDPIDALAVLRLVPELFQITKALEAAAPGRHFTPDGHLVGSIGEPVDGPAGKGVGGSDAAGGRLMAYVYLVKLFRMHKIGRTDSFERRMEQLKPAELIAKKSTNRSRDLEAELHKHFERKRLPQSEWFALSPKEVEQCLAFMGANRVKRPKPKKPTTARRANRATPEELAQYRKQAGLD